MTRRVRSSTRYPLICAAVIFVTAAAAAVTLAWAHPGIVICAGYLEPEDWVPLFAPSGGLICEGVLQDGQVVKEGDDLLKLDDRLITENLNRIRHELGISLSESARLADRSRLFSIHRAIEEAELRRRLETDRLLLENSSLSRDQMEHTQYLFESFIAGADREESEIRSAADQARSESERLAIEETLWMRHLEDLVLSAPISGRFLSVEAVHAGKRVMIPGLEPGRAVEAGQMLGYLITETSMTARIGIPQNHVSDCRPGQPVLVSPESRSPWRHPPLEGFLLSVSPVASDGLFSAAVELDLPEGTLAELRNLNCVNLTARIDTRTHGGYQTDIRILWARLLEAVTDKEGRPE